MSVRILVAKCLPRRFGANQKTSIRENTRKPLSDNKIAALLADQNINVARRTVAKYREAMMIPPSNERKELT